MLENRHRKVCCILIHNTLSARVLSIAVYTNNIKFVIDN